MSFDLNKLEQLTQQWKDFESQWNTWWAVSLYQNAYDYWKQNWVNEQQLTWLQSRITSLNSQNKPKQETQPTNNIQPTNVNTNTPTQPQNTDTQTQQNISQSTIVPQPQETNNTAQNTIQTSQNTPINTQNSQNTQNKPVLNQQNTNNQKKWALADYNFWHWTTEDWRTQRNQQIAQSYIDNKKTPDALELYKNIKEQAPNENTQNIMNTVRSIQNDFNNKSWINNNPQVVWAKANNVDMSIVDWKPVFKPNSISQTIAMYKEFWPNVPVDKINEATIKWSAAYWIISKYNNWSVEQITQWLDNWDLAPWSQSWKDMITLNWGITPNMEQAEKQYIQKQKIDVVKNAVTNMVDWPSKTVWTTWTTWTIQKVNPIISVQKVLANLKTQYTKQSNIIIWKEETVREDYYKAHPEVKKSQEELTTAQTELTKLQIAKQKLYNDIVNKYKWLTTWQAIAMANKQWRAIDEQIFQATLKVNTAMSNYQYNWKIAEQSISDKYKIFQSQLSNLSNIYNSDVSQWLSLSKMLQTQNNFEAQLKQSKLQYETSLVNWNQQAALKYAREMSLIKAKQWSIKNTYKLFKWANWVTLKYNVATWKVETIWSQSTNKEINNTLNILEWKQNNWTFNIANINRKLDFSKDTKLLQEAANNNEAWVKNNNPTWITMWISKWLKDAWTKAWIKFSAWTARNSKEWWNYFKFNTVYDWMRAYDIALTRWWWSIYQRLMSWKGAWTIWAKKQYAKSIMDAAWIPIWKTFKDLQPSQLATLEAFQLKRESPVFYKWVENGFTNNSQTTTEKLSVPEILNKIPLNQQIALWKATWVNLTTELSPTFPWATPSELSQIFNAYNKVANWDWYTLWIPSHIYHWLIGSVPTQLRNSDAERVQLLKRIRNSYNQLIRQWVKNPSYWQTVWMFSRTPLSWIKKPDNAIKYNNLIKLWQAVWQTDDLEKLWNQVYLNIKESWAWKATHTIETKRIDWFIKEHPNFNYVPEWVIKNQKDLYSELKSSLGSLSKVYNSATIQNAIKDKTTNFTDIEWQSDVNKIIRIRQIIWQLNQNYKNNNNISDSNQDNVLSNISDKWTPNAILSTAKSNIDNSITSYNSLRKSLLLPALKENEIWNYNNRYNIDFPNSAKDALQITK